LLITQISTWCRKRGNNSIKTASACKADIYNTTRLHSRTRDATIGAMNDFAALSRMLENLIRFGVIANVQMEPPRGR